MGNLLYTIAVVLVILWAIGFLGFHVGGSIIHVLLVLAIVSVLIRVIRGDRPL
ncbi:MAG: lmo0937 family membrane protein [Saprospiraceae bacterium]